ncbi:MAG: NAD(P) transhydrogenase subunit alpha [Dehalococcoidia bacterium]|nr:NAD(P) transhydrogenase subunit alpha [Dehalococcoidia bacterium]
MELIPLIIIFVLAIFIGYEVITKVPPTLHTPLMSGSNAISGIVIVGAIIIASNINSTIGTVFSVVAIALATINVVGGFLITDRMLAMFKKSKK